MTLLAILGLVAGALTTVAGLGGGVLLVAALSVMFGPRMALAVTTPALLVSNLHRAMIYRKEVNRSVATAFALGAVPGALAGGLLVPAIPERLLDVLLVAMTILAVLRSRGRLSFHPGPRAIAPAGFGIGVLSASAGGAGALTSPLFLSAGLSGEAYVATVSLSAGLLHMGRAIGYGLGGTLTSDLLPKAAVLMIGLIAGNAAGSRLRKLVPAGVEKHVEIGALVVATLLTVLRVAR
jgi:hypothetical protein